MAGWVTVKQLCENKDWFVGACVILSVGVLSFSGNNLAVL